MVLSRKTKSIKFSSKWNAFVLISACKFLFGSKTEGTRCPLYNPHEFSSATEKKLKKPNSGMVWAHPWGQHSHLRGNFRPRIAARRQREVMATMVLQENNGHEVVVGRTDTGTGDSGTGHASPHRASAERERMAILVSNDNQVKCWTGDEHGAETRNISPRQRLLLKRRQFLSWSRNVLILWNLNVHQNLHKILPVGLILNQLNLVYTLTY